MVSSKQKDGFKNIMFAIISQVITLVFGFIVPKLLIEHLGSESNGLMQTINQIFSYFTLIEAGIGTATIQSLYQPITNDDKNEINSILSATNNYYKKISIIYLAFLILFAFIFSEVINSSISVTKIFWIVFFTGLNSVVNFAIQGKYSLLLDASGKKYIVTIFSSIFLLLNYISKIILLLLGFDLLMIQIVYFFLSLIQVVGIMIYIRKYYSWINLNVKPNYEAISKKNAVLVHQISALVFNNTDVLLISMMCGLVSSSIYSMYLMVTNVINTLFNNIYSGLTSILGQTFFTNIELYKKRIDLFDLFFQTFVFAISTIVYIFYLPFLKLYTKGFDYNYIFSWLPALFILVVLLNATRQAWNITIKVAGHFKQTEWRTILEMILNISSSIILINKLGIAGALLGTIIALSYRTNDIIWYANKIILKRKPWKTYKLTIINTLIMLTIIYTSKLIPINTSNYISMIISAVIYTIVVLPLFYCVALFFFKDEYKILVNEFIKFRSKKHKKQNMKYE